MSPSRPYTFDRVVRIFFTVVAIVAIYFLLNAIKDALLPFIVACLLAYILEPLVLWNKRILHLRKRFIPVVLALVEVCGLFTLFCYIFIPYLGQEMAAMADTLTKYANAQINIPFISRSMHQWMRENIDFNSVAKFLSQPEWNDLLKNALAKTWSFVSSGVGFIIGLCSWLIVILYLIFIMIDYERLMLSFRQLVPKRHRERTFRILDDVTEAMNCYFRGQFTIAMIVGVLFAIGFFIIGLPMGILLGLFIGVLNLVPYLQLISLPVTAVLCIVATVSTGVDFWVIFWEAMAVYVVVQCIQDLFLTPKIMGKAMGLNPAIILLSLSVWGTLLGFLGLIIALPLTTLLLSYYNQYVISRELEAVDNDE